MQFPHPMHHKASSIASFRPLSRRIRATFSAPYIFFKSFFSISAVFEGPDTIFIYEVVVFPVA